jgi:hypothetical protein
MNPLETEIMERALRGDHPLLASLRLQLVSASVREREFTGTGFMTAFSLPAEAPRATSQDRMVIGDVAAEVSGLPLGAGFLVFVTGGLLDALEGYSYDATWAEDATLHRSFYVHPDPSGRPGLVETTERDLNWALRDAV